MTFEKAAEALAQRTLAVAGLPADSETTFRMVPGDPARMILVGLVEPEELDEVLEGLHAAGHNALVALALSTPMNAGQAIQASMAQMLYLGFLMGRGRS